MRQVGADQRESASQALLGDLTALCGSFLAFRQVRRPLPLRLRALALSPFPVFSASQWLIPCLRSVVRRQ